MNPATRRTEGNATAPVSSVPLELGNKLGSFRTVTAPRAGPIPI